MNTIVKVVIVQPEPYVCLDSPRPRPLRRAHRFPTSIHGASRNGKKRSRVGGGREKLR
ncbi:hypothetical protein K438DRAFT_1828744, partial [Mycena galopus ATCC 62051]